MCLRILENFLNFKKGNISHQRKEVIYMALAFIGVALAIGLAALGSAIGQGIATKGAMEGIARQPEAAGDIRTNLLLALAFMEALTLFSFVIAILMWTKL